MSLLSWARAALAGQDHEALLPEGAQLMGLSVAQALNAHHDWMQRFETALEGKGPPLDPGEIAQDDHCILGSWLHAAATRQRLGAMAEFEHLHEVHAAFHRLASLIVSALHERNDREAHTLLRLLQAKSREIRLGLARLMAGAGSGG